MVFHNIFFSKLQALCQKGSKNIMKFVLNTKKYNGNAYRKFTISFENQYIRPVVSTFLVNIFPRNLRSNINGMLKKNVMRNFIYKKQSIKCNAEIQFIKTWPKLFLRKFLFHSGCQKWIKLIRDHTGDAALRKMIRQQLTISHIIYARIAENFSKHKKSSATL